MRLRSLTSERGVGRGGLSPRSYRPVLPQFVATPQLSTQLVVSVATFGESEHAVLLLVDKLIASKIIPPPSVVAAAVRLLTTTILPPFFNLTACYLTPKLNLSGPHRLGANKLLFSNDPHQSNVTVKSVSRPPISDHKNSRGRVRCRNRRGRRFGRWRRARRRRRRGTGAS
jgi:hypothetical protein